MKTFTLCLFFLLASAALAKQPFSIWSHPANAKLMLAVEKNPWLVNHDPLPGQPINQLFAFVLYDRQPAASITPIPNQILPAPCQTTAVSHWDCPAGVPPDVWEGIVEAACRAGIRPRVVLAIVDHETANRTSHLYRQHNNPGGIEFKPEWGCGRTGRYSSFATKAEGSRALGEVLSNRRYAAGRHTNDPFEQIRIISEGGYAAYSPSWPKCVARHYRRRLE